MKKPQIFTILERGTYKLIAHATECEILPFIGFPIEFSKIEAISKAAKARQVIETEKFLILPEPALKVRKTRFEKEIFEKEAA